MWKMVIAFMLSSSIANATRLDGSYGLVEPSHPGSLTLHLNDDVVCSFGGACSSPNYWIVYNSTSTRLEQWTTDSNGSDVDGLVWHVEDGTDDLSLDGSLLISLAEQIVLDDDGDSYVYCSVDDVCHWYSGADEMIEANGVTGLLYLESNTMLKDGKQLRWGTGSDYYIRYLDGVGLQLVGFGGGTVIVHAVDSEGTIYFDKQIVVTGISAASPAEPFTCDADHFGAIVPVDDSDDTSWSGVCTCANLDGTGYDWRDIGDIAGTACPFF